MYDKWDVADQAQAMAMAGASGGGAASGMMTYSQFKKSRLSLKSNQIEPPSNIQ